MRICFDLDSALCDGHKTNSEGIDYSRCQPKAGSAAVLRGYKKYGHTVIIESARDVDSDCDTLSEMTLQQLKNWGFVYDEVYFRKPIADLHVSGNAMDARRFWNNQLERPEWQ